MGQVVTRSLSYFHIPQVIRINAALRKLAVKCLCLPRGPQQLFMLKGLWMESQGVSYKMVGVLQQRGGLPDSSLVLRVWPTLMKSLRFLLPRQWNCHCGNSLVRWNSNKMVGEKIHPLQAHCVSMIIWELRHWSKLKGAADPVKILLRNVVNSTNISLNITLWFMNWWDSLCSCSCFRASFELKRHSERAKESFSWLICSHGLFPSYLHQHQIQTYALKKSSWVTHDIELS